MSPGGAIAVTSTSASLAALGSKDVELTAAVPERGDEAASVTCTVTCTVTEAPVVTGPIAQVTVLPEADPPLSALTKVVPAGRSKVASTPVASAGPSSVTTIVYVRSESASTGSAPSSTR